MFRIQKAAKRTRSCSSSSIYKIRSLVTQAAEAEKGSSVIPQKSVEYPKILDVSPKAEHRRLQEAYFDRIKKIGTVEEKLLALNLPKYYGWPSFILKENFVPYNFLPFSQFITRTVISESKRLPTYLPESEINRLKERLKQELEKVIVFEEKYARRKYEVERLYMKEEALPFYDDELLNDMKTRRLVDQINSAIVRVIASDYPHFISAQMSLKPRIEAFWRVGGFYATEVDKKLRREKKIDESMIDDPIDRFFQYFGTPILQLRSKNPLQTVPKILLDETESEIQNQIEGNLQITAGTTNDASIISDNENSQLVVSNDSISANGEKEYRKLYPLQEYRYSPDLYLEIPRQRYHGAVIPGFWPNDPHRFGIVSYHSTSHCLNRPAHYGSEEHIEALHSQAILASYAWSYGQACYHGFTTYNDITYPFVTQAVLTNGKMFSFYQYQLNTIVLHTDKNESGNPLYNECYATPPSELYHELDADKIKGWNDATIVNLLNVYTKDRRNAEEMELTPYLNGDQKLISQIPEDKRRKWLHERYRNLTSHRPRHKLDPEIYDWERIYKIENQKRVTDARKRFFEKFEDPINDKKLNEHLGEYIPKVFRANTINKKVRHDEKFYPDVFPDYHEIV